MDSITEISIKITWLLRHGAIKEKVSIDNEGFVEVEELISWLKKNNIFLTLEDIQTLVMKDNKSRYLLKDNKIRANQGHSIKLDITMNTFEQKFSHVIHATYSEHLEGIKKNGLKSMSRNDVHMINIDSKTNKFHMIRQDTTLYIFVKGNGVNLKESTNGVILTKYVPPENLIIVPTYQFKKSNCYGFIIYDVTKSKVITVKTKNNYYGFPKGKKEKDELPICCAFRGLKEKTNLDPEDIYILPGCVSEINENDDVPTNYYFGMIRNTEKKIYCLDKGKKLDVSLMNKDELIQMENKNFLDRRSKLLKN